MVIPTSSWGGGGGSNGSSGYGYGYGGGSGNGMGQASGGNAQAKIAGLLDKMKANAPTQPSHPPNGNYRPAPWLNGASAAGGAGSDRAATARNMIEKLKGNGAGYGSSSASNAQASMSIPGSSMSIQQRMQSNGEGMAARQAAAGNNARAMLDQRKADQGSNWGVAARSFRDMQQSKATEWPSKANQGSDWSNDFDRKKANQGMIRPSNFGAGSNGQSPMSSKLDKMKAASQSQAAKFKVAPSSFANRASGQVGKIPAGSSQQSWGGQKNKWQSAAATSKGSEPQVKMSISKESQSLLHAALEASADVSEMSQPQKRGRYDDDEEQPRQKFQRKQREATVPQRAPGNRKLQSVREVLPTFEFRSQILRAIAKNQVIIVEGETGCGKTTQVGQFILEDAEENNIPCSVVCTQPRRISAIGVADRVADERGERVGGTIGYSVRQESKAGPDTHLLFCTTGILLRRLENDSDLTGTTHVVVDEVHERGVESDFLLLALRDLSRRRPQLKVILMSATMDKDLFGRYFGGAPGIVIPGRTFPVQDFFLEDALKITKHVLNPQADWAIGGGKGKGKGTPASTNKDHADARKLEDLGQVRDRYAKYGPQVQAALRGMDQDAVNYDLIASLLNGDMLEELARSGSPVKVADGAPKRPNGVLVFLSGAKEIETVQLALLSTPEFQREPARSWVLPLHGGLPSDEQKRVFLHPPEGVRKIVLSTNVAETSITIDDVGFVIDTCRMKEMRFDAVRRMSSLEDTVVSRTNARQRRGRAGRVAPGVAVHLGLTRFRHDQKVDDHQPPEVQRVPLEQLVLRIHATGLHLRDQAGKAATVCAKLLEPPNPLYVKKSVEELVRLGAIEVDPATGREKLTPLGKHLSNLPLEARLGKLVLFGAAFGPAATDAALTVAAALTSRNPFLAPLEVREEAAKAKKSFADKMVGGPIGLSDHLAVLQAYQEWDEMPHRGDQRYEFCRASFLSIKTLQGMSEMKRSLLETLSEAGFVGRRLRAKEVAWTGRQNDCDGVLLALSDGKKDVEDCPAALVAALLCAALFPQVATATVSRQQQATTWKKQQNIAKNGGGVQKPKLMVKDAANGEPVKVKMHPGSVAANETTFSSPYIVYQELVSTTQLYVRDITPVPPLALALFGGPLTMDKGHGTLLVDGWISLAVPSFLREPLLEMRRRLDALFAGWVAERGGNSGSQDLMSKRGGTELLKAIVDLLENQEETAPVAAPMTRGEMEQEAARQRKMQKGQQQGKKHKNNKGVKKGGNKNKGGWGRW